MHTCNLSSTLPCLNNGGCNDSITIRNRGFTAGVTQLSQSGESARNTFNSNEHQFLYRCIVKADKLIGGGYDQVCVCDGLMKTAKRFFLLLHRACCRVTQLLHQPLHIYKICTLKH